MRGLICICVSLIKVVYNLHLENSYPKLPLMIAATRLLEPHMNRLQLLAHRSLRATAGMKSSGVPNQDTRRADSRWKRLASSKLHNLGCLSRDCCAELLACSNLRSGGVLCVSCVCSSVCLLDCSVVCLCVCLVSWVFACLCACFLCLRG